MNLQSFVQKYTGTLQDFDGGYGGQCVDYARLYVESVWAIKSNQVLPSNPVQGGAKHAFTDYPASLINYRSDLVERISNTPVNFPLAGDIIIWDRQPSNVWGHIAIVLTANTNTITVSEQNTGNGDGRGQDDAIRTRKYFDYSNVLGWLRLRNPARLELPSNAAALNLDGLNPDEKAAIELKNMVAIANTLRDRSGEINNLKVQIIQKDIKIKELETEKFERQNNLQNVKTIELQSQKSKAVMGDVLSPSLFEIPEFPQPSVVSSDKDEKLDANQVANEERNLFGWENQLKAVESFIRIQLPTILSVLTAYGVVVHTDQAQLFLTGLFTGLSFLLSHFLELKKHHKINK